MKNNFFLIGIFTLMIIIGFTFTACDDDNGGKSENGNNGGTFTLNGIPAKCNGLYAVLVSYDSDFNVNLFGFESINISTKIVTGVKISNGSVIIPLWKPDKGNYVKYMGTDNFRAYISIIENQSVTMPNNGVEFAWTDSSFKVGVGFPAFNFSNGNAEKNWNENNDVDNNDFL